MRILRFTLSRWTTDGTQVPYSAYGNFQVFGYVDRVVTDDTAQIPWENPASDNPWLDLKAQKQKLWKERGYLHYERMDDEQLTDSLHTVIFPNITISFLPDHIIFFRSEPHPDDPNKCSFDL